jgi:hypothetical protein
VQKYEGYSICFYLLNSNEVVGSNDELCFAYEDTGSSVLELELRLQRLSKKRSIDQLSDQETEDNQISITSTKWKNSEIALFGAGVRLYGWGRWKSIQVHVKTRNAQAVRNFARTSKGLRCKILDSRFKNLFVVPETLADLANGFSKVSDMLSLANEEPKDDVEDE